MDVNANLAELRGLVNANIDREYVSDDATARMMELFVALDEWLINGGFLPADWQR
jgi:hypothetical protein